MKEKQCAVCGGEFQPNNSMQKVCSYDCAKVYANKDDRHKALKKRHKEEQPLSVYLKKAQIACNAYIRERDAGKPCISCNRNTGAKMNAGHYRSVGANPELRFTELNIHLQCEKCNSHLSGNIIEYRKGLKAKIGEKNLEWLEGPHQAQHWTREDAQNIARYFKEKLKRLQEQEE